jgi:hypothetical protein
MTHPTFIHFSFCIKLQILFGRHSLEQTAGDEIAKAPAEEIIEGPADEGAKVLLPDELDELDDILISMSLLTESFRSFIDLTLADSLEDAVFLGWSQ